MLLYLFALGSIGAIIFYIFIYFTQLKPVFCTSDKSLSGKTVVITGGTSGIGFEVALDMAARGARVITASKSKFHGEAAVRKIQAKTNNLEVFHYTFDLADFDSVREFAQLLTSSEPNINILINNAAISYTTFEDERTRHGYDRVFSTNYLGHFLLTYLLINHLKSSSPTRIVNVSSASHAYTGSINFTLQDAKHGSIMYPHLQGYDVSKLAMVLHVKELTRNYAGYGITANAVHPGLCVHTTLWSSMKLFWPQWVTSLVIFCLRALSMTTTAAAQTVIYCAVSDEVSSVSGKYFVRCKQARESITARDVAIARQTWDVSMLLTGCKKAGGSVEPLDGVIEEVNMVHGRTYEQLRNPYTRGEVQPIKVPEVMLIEER